MVVAWCPEYRLSIEFEDPEHQPPHVTTGLRSPFWLWHAWLEIDHGSDLYQQCLGQNKSAPGSVQLSVERFFELRLRKSSTGQWSHLGQEPPWTPRMSCHKPRISSSIFGMWRLPSGVHGRVPGRCLFIDPAASINTTARATTFICRMLSYIVPCGRYS